MERIGKIINEFEELKKEGVNVFFDDEEGKKIIAQETKAENAEKENIKHMVKYVFHDNGRRFKETASLYIKNLEQYLKDKNFAELICSEIHKWK